MVFDNEITPFTRFSILTRILTWDQKWIYATSHFKLHSNNKITSLGIMKIVFKEADGRTVRPEEIFEFCGYFKDETEEEKEEREKRRQLGMKFVEGILPIEQLIDPNVLVDPDNIKKGENDKILAKL